MLSRIAPYLELTKPRIAVMVLVMAALGFYVGGMTVDGFPGWMHFFFAMLGTGLAGGGASVLNQYLERDIDARMERTRNRPIPTGKISPATALYYGVALAMGGVALLVLEVNLLAAFLALQSAFLYVLVYTPMKRLTWWNTSVGAIPGAMPPLIGWAAATGSLGPGAWILFAILYIWQHPHFFAIAWMYREDYARGGLRMLPVVHPDGRNMFAQVLLFSLVLIPVSILPSLLGMTGGTYLAGATLLGVAMLVTGIVFAVQQTHGAARRVMRVSLLYLPGLFLVVLLDTAIHLP